MPLWWKKQAPTPSPASPPELVHEEVTSTSVRMPETDFMLVLVSAYWTRPQGLLLVTRVKIWVVTLPWSPALHHKPLVLLVLHTRIDVVINSGELPCLSEKSDRHVSLSTVPKALGVLFYGSGSGKLNAIFLYLGDCIQIQTNKD